MAEYQCLPDLTFRVGVLETALKDALCWLWAHSSIPEAEVLADRLAREAEVPPGPCRECGDA